MRCGGEVFYEVREPGTGFVPVCPVHDVVGVHEKRQAKAEVPFSHEACFPAMMPPSTRRRGLTQADVRGVARQSKPPPVSGAQYLNPYEGPSRPS
jgi:hypothetical protein